MESGWNVSVWLVGLVSRRRVWLVGVESMGVVSIGWMWVESMGVASGCGCKEVYRFPHITYPYSLLLYLFVLQQHPYFLFNILNVFRSCFGTVL